MRACRGATEDMEQQPQRHVLVEGKQQPWPWRPWSSRERSCSYGEGAGGEREGEGAVAHRGEAAGELERPEEDVRRPKDEVDEEAGVV